MITEAVESYIAMRRCCGFVFRTEAEKLRSFAAYSAVRNINYIRSEIAIEWALQSPSVCARARKLGAVIRLARYIRAEDLHHELPQPIFGSESKPRPVPYIFSREDVQRLVQAAGEMGSKSLRRDTYSTFFALLACTGLRLSEAIRLRYADITADGLVIRCTKFRKNRLVVLHETARQGIEHYLERRRCYASFDDHVFISLRRKPLIPKDAQTAFRTAADRIGLRRVAGQPRPTIHSLRHTFTVRALEACPDDRERITQHMMALSTHLGHGHVGHTYWYLQATPELMGNISKRFEAFVTGDAP